MVKYNCKTCGADIYFDAKSGKMKHKYHDSTFDITSFAIVDNNASNMQCSKTDVGSVLIDDSEVEHGNLIKFKCE